MKIKYKHISFEEYGDGKFYICNNNDGIILGATKYYDNWNQWVFYPVNNALFSKSCLLDIADFLNQL